MPNPSNYDDQGKWMEACMSARHDEHPNEDQEQSVAICMQMWRDRDKAMPSSSADRAWSKLTIKTLNAEQRVIEGMASTPSVDRIGDVVEPLGAKFSLPMPLLYHHKKDQPIGQVISARATKDGISIKAQLAMVSEPGALKDRIDTAWQEIKAGLVRGLSIGFRALETEFLEGKSSGGLRFLKSEIFELSLVTIPANADASISVIKSLDLGDQAASGTKEVQTSRPGGTGSTDGSPAEGSKSAKRRSRSVTLQSKKDREKMKTFSEQVVDLENTRAGKAARMAEIMQRAVDEGRSTDESEQDEFDDLEREVEALDKDIKRFKVLERHNKEQATPVSDVKSPEDGAASRGGSIRVVHQKPEKGIQFARIARCIGLAKGSLGDAYQIGQALYGEKDPEVVEILKVQISAGSTGGWAKPLVGTETSAFADFAEWLRPQTIVGKFGANGVPAMRRVPFRVALVGQTSGGDAYWTGEGAGKGLTKFSFQRTTLEPLKLANICVITEEVLRDSSPSAEAIIRDQIAAALRERLDRDFIDPANSGSAGVKPASITNGVTAITSVGADAVAVRKDIKALFAAFIAQNNAPTSGVWIMKESTALTLSLMMNPLGQPSFPDVNMSGGRLFGLPVIVSEFVPVTVASPLSQYIILANAQDIYLADDGEVTVDMSREASLQMESNPTMTSVASGGGSPSALTPTTVVSLWQTNSVGFRAERTINWKLRRTGAVQVLQDVLYAPS